MMRFVLASGSPRRQELLRTCGITIDCVQAAGIEERRKQNESPLNYCMRLAREKAQAVAQGGDCVLAADTIVAIGDTIFEKPATPTENLNMLLALSKEWHVVISSWCIIKWPLTGKPTQIDGHSTTKVKFRSLSEKEIKAYVKTGEGADKAGGYGIQGKGAALISTIEGSYSNVVGLPMEMIMPKLIAWGFAQ